MFLCKGKGADKECSRVDFHLILHWSRVECTLVVELGIANRV